MAADFVPMSPTRMLDARGRCDSNRPRSGTWLKTIMAFSVGLLGALAVSVQADATGYCPTALGVNPTKGTISALLSDAAVRHDLPSYVVKAIAYQESGWQQFSPSGELICNPDPGVADGLPGGIGIMQITGSTATAYDINRLATDIAYNIDVGATVLAAKWTTWSKNSDGFADDPREIIENWLYTLRGYNGAWGYAFQVAALVRNPPAALSGLAPAFPFSLATDVIPGFDYPTQAVQAQAGNRWVVHGAGIPTRVVSGPTHNWRTGAPSGVSATVVGVSNMRADVSTSSAVLVAIPNGTVLGLECWRRGEGVAASTGTYSLWHQVSYGGQRGFISDTRLNTPAFPQAGADQPAAGEPACAAPAAVPSPPLNVRVSSGVNSISVSWDAPSSDGGSPLTGFAVTTIPGDAATNVGAGDRSVVVPDLAAGVPFMVNVQARNAVGLSGVAAAGPVVPLAPASVPGVPLGVVAVAGNGSASVSWSVPGSDGGSPVTGYRVASSLGGFVDTSGSSVTFTGLVKGAVYSFVVSARNAVGFGAGASSNQVTIPLVLGSGPEVVPLVPEFVSLVPERLLDTRSSGQVGYVGGKPVAGQVLQLQVTGRGGVADDAKAVVLNVTGNDATGGGFVTVWPCGTVMPTASNLNLEQGETKPNLVISKVGVGGKVCVFTQNGTHLLADINGYWN
jgi:hypothetical protein